MIPSHIGQILRIDEIWLSREPLDMRSGPETTLARVVKAFGAAKPHCAYVFANKRANRVKVLVCDAFGIWLAAPRLHQGRFVWTRLRSGGHRCPAIAGAGGGFALAVRGGRLCN